MREYEIAFLISPNLSEEETEKIISRMATVISSKKGKMIKEDRWGKRKLAYPIQKFEEAFYVFFHYEGDTSISFELERRFKQTEAILRFLTVKKEVKKKTREKKKAAPEAKESPPPKEEKPLKKERRKKEISGTQKSSQEEK
jgi:small subunit ribosomal protein S6